MKERRKLERVVFVAPITMLETPATRPFSGSAALPAPSFARDWTESSPCRMSRRVNSVIRGDAAPPFRSPSEPRPFPC
jgi:hypothetical protein